MEGRKSIPLHGPGLIEVCRGENHGSQFPRDSQVTYLSANNEYLICEYLWSSFFGWVSRGSQK